MDNLLKVTSLFDQTEVDLDGVKVFHFTIALYQCPTFNQMPEKMYSTVS